MHDKRIRSTMGLQLLNTVRGICGRLPEVVEAVDGFGHTSFRIRDKPFVMLGEGEDGASMSVKTDPVTQKALIAEGRFYRTPYIGQHGWVSFKAETEIVEGELAELVLEAFDRVAPKRLRR